MYSLFYNSMENHCCSIQWRMNITFPPAVTRWDTPRVGLGGGPQFLVAGSAAARNLCNTAMRPEWRAQPRPPAEPPGTHTSGWSPSLGAESARLLRHVLADGQAMALLQAEAPAAIDVLRQAVTKL